MSAHDVEVFYDGDCALCSREIALLRGLDRRGRVLFVDIADSSFDARAVGVPWETLMAQIHARLPDGRLITGVEVFRRLYSAVGFGLLVAVTRWPGVRHALDRAYVWFAANRLRWTGRCLDGSCSAGGAAGEFTSAAE